MKKRTLIVFLVILFIIPIALAQSIDVPIKKITYHAEQYETGNINYAQLIIYIASLRQDLVEEMGAIAQGHDEVLKAEQLESALGKPTETTKWAWFDSGDGNGYNKKLDKEAPAWRKIIFDGKKIQIWLNAWPNILEKNKEEFLVYWLHPDIIFKSPEEQINIEGKIEEIKSLAEKYSSNPNEENLRSLAKESVAVEQSFNNYFNQNPAKCGELMNNLFGSENKRDNQKFLAEEIDFFSGDNFEAIMRLEMCDDCNWNGINLNLRFESRGRFQNPEESSNYDKNVKERFMGYSGENFREETGRLIDEIRGRIEAGDYDMAMEKSQELRILTEAWNEKSNDVWKELEDKFRIDFESMTEEERMKCQEDYCWIKKEQERREAEKILRNKNYEERKQFYSDLFSGYEKKEFYYEQEEWEKRLVEEFKEFGEEICSNNIDDNENDQVDCSDSQCGGKLCGYGTVTVIEGNETREEKRELYCIAGTCQAKEEIDKEKIIICGNHICEENEQESCIEDCSICSKYEPLQCAGNVIFSGEDENGCPLEPICLSGNLSCQTEEDCIDPLCGDASCIEGTCQITELVECRESECIDGEEKIQHCESGEAKVVEKCIEGLWHETGIECEIISQIEEKITGEDIIDQECAVKDDCGNENDVCSNGKCITLPESAGLNEREEEIIADEIEREIEEIPEKQEDEEIQEGQEIEQEDSIITGEVIFFLFKTLASKIKVSGLQVEEGIDTGEDINNAEESAVPGEGENLAEGGGNNVEENPQGEEKEQPNEDQQQNEREQQERRQEECSERCSRECYERKIRPCVEDCIWKQCGNELECKIDDVKTSCENECKTNNDLKSCENECSDKCLAGEETWIEPEREEHKQEKFVFTVGGSCRAAQGKTEGFIWFGGWGEEFNDFHLIKNNYHSRGSNDWCKEDLKNLIKQRQELEKSLNQEFASWFFEKYVANSADEWEKHISGIFELYWRDVDISRQMAERLECLGKDGLPEHNLINFKYETDYGSVDFWEEIKTAKIQEDGKESQIISPYMRTWLFPSRDFFKAEMKRSMEKHQLPGPPEEEKRNTLSEEKKRRLMEDDEFMEEIRTFNNNYGESLVIQFKDFNTDEIVFNIYIRINEQELMHFEPMLPSEAPAEDVKIELDVDKLLDIIEYEESGRIELESPPWDRQPRVSFVKGTVDGVRMFFMFRDLINSAIITPQSAEGTVEFFVRNFFEVAMGDGNHEEDGEDLNEDLELEDFPSQLEDQ